MLFILNAFPLWKREALGSAIHNTLITITFCFNKGNKNFLPWQGLECLKQVGEGPC